MAAALREMLAVLGLYLDQGLMEDARLLAEFMLDKVSPNDDEMREHVAGIVGAVGEPRGDLARLALGGGLEQRHGALGVFDRIERGDDGGGIVVAERLPALVPLGHKLGVFFLQMGRVGQHVVAEVYRGR